ncbi:MAG: metal-dependent hydrolase [SAR324 cluster bacterium]|nr:metal-dependent hydrolase [SAR324 cluster bacterium]
MNFKGHAFGGGITGIGVAGLAVFSGAIPVTPEVLKQIMNAPLQHMNPVLMLLSIFAVTWFMSLFPDLDTASVPQRWFFRIMLIILGILYVKRQMDLFALVAFSVLLPVIHKHRGWTHWKITPWLVSAFLAIVYEYFRVQDAWFASFSWHNVLAFLKQYWIFVVGCVAGHYTHLFLDSRSVKWLPFISNSTNHH